MLRSLFSFSTFYTVLIFIFLLHAGVGYSQKEFSQWYFGNGAGINFSSGAPVALTDGNLFTEEGCASVADSKGNMLFYTNGITVWDHRHNIMPNGIGLAGGISSTQSALILPSPGSMEKYYIFTVAEKAGPSGLSYSVVDLLAGSDKKIYTKNQNILLTPDLLFSAVKPDVIKKNIRLLAPVSEKMTSVRHSNGKDFWVIVHQWNTNSFYAFPLTSEGVGKPVVSSIGSVHRESGAGSFRESIGCLVSSPDGKKLCSAICYKPDNDLELFRFDNSTGLISDLQKIRTKGFGYGLAFSPDNSKLYVSFLKGEAGIIQYDLNEKEIERSAVVIAYNRIENIVFGAMQRGPDNKIYVAKTGQYLDIIHLPNLKGAGCGYEDDGVFLHSKYSVYGLPAEVLTAAKELAVVSKENPVPPATVKTEVPAKGITQPDCVGKAPVISLPFDTTVVCKSEIILDAGNEGSQFLWSTRETTRKISVKESGNYTVTVTKVGCAGSKTVKVEFMEKPTVFNYLPEFKPSNSMFNYAFQYSINDVTSFEIKVFSPGGKLVFESSDPKKFWDGKNKKGKLLPSGEYSWIVKYLPRCGNQSLQTKEGKVKMVD